MPGHTNAQALPSVSTMGMGIVSELSGTTLTFRETSNSVPMEFNRT
jgi:hypothetical protein